MDRALPLDGETFAPKAIETRYNGYFFRSRLEARWAVFLGTLDIKFHYEPEGFKLPSGTCYLPDFFLPQIRMWAEVKPLRFTRVERDKVLELVDVTGYPCLLLSGPPEFCTYRAVFSTTLEDGNALGSNRWECSYMLDVDYHGRKHFNDGRLFHCGVNEFVTEMAFSREYAAAVRAARCERFQGEAA